MYLIKNGLNVKKGIIDLFCFLFLTKFEMKSWDGLQSGGSADIGEKDADRGCQAGGKVEDFRED